MSETKRRGRPPLREGERKSANMKFRTREGMRERLEAAAVTSGRSASEEAERRLERSFDRDDLRTIIREEIRAALSPLVPGSRSVLVTEDGERDLGMLNRLQILGTQPIPPSQMP